MASDIPPTLISSASISRPQSAAANGPSAKGTVVCVFCGSSPGTSPAHLAAARSLAHLFHKNSISLVYGGGTVGIMGELARTLVTLSGAESVHGIIPDALVKFEQEGREGKTDVKSTIDEAIFGRTTVVTDMHSRKHLMAKRVMEGGPGSGFVALSGGFGTMEELMEVVTWNQLGIHGCGIVVFNVEGYYDGLIDWIRTAVSSGFISGGNAGILVEALSAEECIRCLQEYKVSEERMQLDWSQK
ncbi:MAG: hypothetical protein HETSPECPRED_000267 [Heterodermia speciosa]|uniref:Lysine decarboxylase n=1 Tax=Heterodermia speciosa TaxID=116794 RepID=A0A8H3EVP3_9LECA|nr:MAG: hypothetical protein HETSPECPRED_000267 [Heterodermia speciosa]